MVFYDEKKKLINIISIEKEFDDELNNYGYQLLNHKM